MKIIFTILLFFLVLIFSSCKSSEMKVLNDRVAYATILIDGSVNENSEIKLYLDFKDINMTLHSYEKNRVYLKKEKTNIQIVQKYKTATVNFEVVDEKEYRFKLLKTYDNNLIIVQMKNK